MLHYLTAGHSHGSVLIAILDGFPAGFQINKEKIELELLKRKKTLGRSVRQKQEKDNFEIISGINEAWVTTGASIGVVVYNTVKDTVLPSEEDDFLLPGHIDYPYYYRVQGKIHPYWARERGSARESVLRVILGSIARQALESLGIEIYSLVKSVGKEQDISLTETSALKKSYRENPFLWHYDKSKEDKFMHYLRRVCSSLDTLGGEGEIFIEGLPPGLGRFNQFRERLSSRLVATIFSIPSIKKVQIGEDSLLTSSGSEVVDEFATFQKRKQNKGGGFEGGFTNGEIIKLKIGVKPVPTQHYKEIESYDIKNKVIRKRGFTKRADCCIIKSALVIGENLLSLEILSALLEAFNSFTFSDLQNSFLEYRNFKD
jgi:chorismate synthase